MILEVHERIQLLNMIPSEGAYEALQTFRIHKEQLSFTPEEVKTINLQNLQQPNGQIRTTWDADKANLVVKDIPIDKYMTSLFSKKIAELEKSEKLTEQTMSLYEKFVLMRFG